MPLRIGKRPALAHNTETLAHVALIVRNGPDAFLSRGMGTESGTCLITVSGAVAHPGVVEIDAGPRSGTSLYAENQPNRPRRSSLGDTAGTGVGPRSFTTPYASVPLRAIGASAGVGVIAVLGQNACGVAETARIARGIWPNRVPGSAGRASWGSPLLPTTWPASPGCGRPRPHDTTASPTRRGRRPLCWSTPRRGGESRTERPQRLLQGRGGSRKRRAVRALAAPFVAALPPPDPADMTLLITIDPWPANACGYCAETSPKRSSSMNGTTRSST